MDIGLSNLATQTAIRNASNIGSSYVKSISNRCDTYDLPSVSKKTDGDSVRPIKWKPMPMVKTTW